MVHRVHFACPPILSNPHGRSTIIRQTDHARLTPPPGFLRFAGLDRDTETPAVNRHAPARTLSIAAPTANMWRRTYFLLILVRIYFALSPSYLHPDENFQGPEVVAGK